jgi:hypothetical protein
MRTGKRPAAIFAEGVTQMDVCAWEHMEGIQAYGCVWEHRGDIQVDGCVWEYVRRKCTYIV